MTTTRPAAPIAAALIAAALIAAALIASPAAAQTTATTEPTDDRHVSLPAPCRPAETTPPPWLRIDRADRTRTVARADTAIWLAELRISTEIYIGAVMLEVDAAGVTLLLYGDGHANPTRHRYDTIRREADCTIAVLHGATDGSTPTVLLRYLRPGTLRAAGAWPGTYHINMHVHPPYTPPAW